jgi:hypothetical protein
MHFADSNRDSNPGERLRTTAYKYGNDPAILIVWRTPTDGGVRTDTVCKTVYRWFESSPWDHVLGSKSALAGADCPFWRAADSYRDSNA